MRVDRNVYRRGEFTVIVAKTARAAGCLYWRRVSACSTHEAPCERFRLRAILGEPETISIPRSAIPVTGTHSRPQT